jgi:hypothetical protein
VKVIDAAVGVEVFFILQPNFQVVLELFDRLQNEQYWKKTSEDAVEGLDDVLYSTFGYPSKEVAKLEATRFASHSGLLQP